MTRSHPESPNYGKHWTADEVVRAFAPSDDTVAEVRAWLNEAGIDDSRLLHTENQGWLAFPATNAEAESLLHTEYYHYVNEISGSKVMACEECGPFMILIIKRENQSNTY